MAMKKAEKAKLTKALPPSRKPSGGKVLSSASKKAARKPQPKLARKGRGAAVLEVQLRKTVAELGLTEARKIFASVEAAFEQDAAEDRSHHE